MTLTTAIQRTTLEFTYSGTTLSATLTADDGFVFTRAPRMVYDNTTGTSGLSATASLNSDRTIATFSVSGIADGDYEILGAHTLASGYYVPVSSLITTNSGYWFFDYYLDKGVYYFYVCVYRGSYIISTSSSRVPYFIYTDANGDSQQVYLTISPNSYATGDGVSVDDLDVSVTITYYAYVISGSRSTSYTIYNDDDGLPYDGYTGSTDDTDDNDDTDDTYVLDNQVAHTTAKCVVSGSTATFTLTCDDGYTFTSAPTISYLEEGVFDMDDSMTLSSDKTTATYSVATSELEEGGTITFTGSTSASSTDGGDTDNDNDVTTLTLSNNVDNTTATYTIADSTATITLTCNDGYTFDGTITIEYGDTTATMDVDDSNTIATYSIDTSGLTDGETISISGSTTASSTDGGDTDNDNDVTTLTLSNNVDNTTATYTIADDTATITLTCNDGYTFDGTITIEYGDTTATMDVDDSNTIATYSIDTSGLTDGETISISGNTTASSTDGGDTDGGDTDNDAGITFVNNIDSDVINITYTYNTSTHVFTLTGTLVVQQDTGAPYCVFDATLSYTDTDNTAQTADVDVSLSSGNTILTLSCSLYAQNGTTITLDGTYARCVYVINSLSNVTNSLPLAYPIDADVTITLTPVSNYYFKTAPCVETTTGALLYTATLNDDGSAATLTLPFTTDDYLSAAAFIEFTGGAVLVNSAAQTYGAINIYVVDDDLLDSFAKLRFYEFNDYTQEYVDYANYVSSIKRLCFDVTATTSADITTGPYNTGLTSYTPDATQYTFDFGTITIPTYNDNGADYNSTLLLFVPLYGTYEVPVQYIGMELGLYYILDIVTGRGNAFITIDGVIIEILDVQCAVNLAYRTLIVYTNTNDYDTTLNPVVKGTIPYITATFHKAYTTLTHQYGASEQLSDLSGFFAFDYISGLSGNMLSEERTMIIQLLNKGVIL